MNQHQKDLIKMYLLEINEIKEDKFEVLYTDGLVHFTKIFTNNGDALEFVSDNLSMVSSN